MNRWPPHATEFVHDVKYAIALNYTFTGRIKGAFAHVVTYTKHVNLGFCFGVELADPKKILLGDGKRIRHIRIASQADLARPYVRTFLREAIARSPTSEMSETGIQPANFPKTT